MLLYCTTCCTLFNVLNAEYDYHGYLGYQTDLLTKSSRRVELACAHGADSTLYHCCNTRSPTEQPLCNSIHNSSSAANGSVTACCCCRHSRQLTSTTTVVCCVIGSAAESSCAVCPESRKGQLKKLRQFISLSSILEQNI